MDDTPVPQRVHARHAQQRALHAAEERRLFCRGLLCRALRRLIWLRATVACGGVLEPFAADLGAVAQELAQSSRRSGGSVSTARLYAGPLSAAPRGRPQRRRRAAAPPV